jgi:hypothetical protein
MPKKKIESSDWRFTMDQIGRELGKIYRQSKRLPRRLRAALTQLDRKMPARRGRQWNKQRFKKKAAPFRGPPGGEFSMSTLRTTRTGLCCSELRSPSASQSDRENAVRHRIACGYESIQSICKFHSAGTSSLNERCGPPIFGLSYLLAALARHYRRWINT